MNPEDLFRLGSEAGFVFRGRALPDRQPELDVASRDIPLLTVEVQEVLRGTAVLQGLVGREVVVAGAHAGERPGTHIFFTNCVSMGRQVLVRELGHGEASESSVEEVRRILELVDLQPLVERIATSALVVAGEVTESSPLRPDAGPASEHDPDWWVARVAVREVLKGRSARRTIEVLFANSRDVAWYQSPKLHPGVTGHFLLHTKAEGEEPREAARAAYTAIDPLDFLPDERQPDVRRALQSTGGAQ